MIGYILVGLGLGFILFDKKKGENNNEEHDNNCTPSNHGRELDTTIKTNGGTERLEKISDNIEKSNNIKENKIIQDDKNEST